MSEQKHNAEGVSLAIFTVCADGDLLRMAQDAPQHVAGIEFAGEFHDYITADRRPRFPDAVKSASGCVAFIDFDKHCDHATETVEALRNLSWLKIISVGVSSQADAALLLRAMRAGCGEFLEKPLDAARFAETLRSLECRFRAVLVPASGGGRVLSLFGAKGGVGVTTLAVHLALYLAAHHGKKTLLIDHHRQLGHVRLHLGLKESQYHFEELVHNADRLDADLLEGFVVRHGSGLNVVVSSDVCGDPSRMTGEEIKHVLQFLRRQFDYIVIDSSLDYGEVTESTIECSDEIYLLTTPEVAALRDLARHAQKLKLSESAASKTRIALNRTAAGDAIGPEQIRQAAGFPVSISIPNNYAELVRAINAGEPIPPQRSSSFATQMKRWASRTCEGDGVEPGIPIRSKFAFWR